MVKTFYCSICCESGVDIIINLQLSFLQSVSIHSRCIVMKTLMTLMLSRTFRNCEGNIAAAVVLEAQLCNEVEMVWEFTYM